MPLSSQPAVLIVGAGTAGLMLACQLASRRIPFRLIDRNAGPAHSSDSWLIQPRSLEIFEHLGLAAEVLNSGQKISGLNFLVNGRWLQHIGLTGPGQQLSAYPFLYLQEQSQTQGLLLDFLRQYHLEVEWDTELLYFEQTDEQVNATIRYKDLAEETLQVSWLAGADGADSLVRRLCQIPFASNAGAQNFWVAHTRVKWDYNYQEVFLCTSSLATATFIPLDQEGTFRVISYLPGSTQNFPANEVMTAELEEKLGLAIEFEDLVQARPYRFVSGYARQLQQGRCFLLGKAAHSHHLIGSPDLNTGVQDAYNLGWKLALVAQGAVAADLLLTYEEERLPVARQAVSSSKTLFKILISPAPQWQFARRHLLPLVLKKLFRYNQLRGWLFRHLAQLHLHYHKRRLSVSAPKNNHFPEQAPKPGDRVPWCHVFSADHEKMLPLYELLQNPYFTLLIFKSSFSQDRAEQLQEEIEQALEPFNPELVTTSIIFPHEENQHIYALFGINEDAFFLIRPDNYIAFRSQPAQVSSLLVYLHQILQPTVLYPGHEEQTTDKAKAEDDDLKNLFDPIYD